MGSMEGWTMIEKEWLEILVCPVCKGGLKAAPTQPGADRLVCGTCRKAYPVRDGIPVMLVEEAEAIGEGPPRRAQSLEGAT